MKEREYPEDFLYRLVDFMCTNANGGRRRDKGECEDEDYYEGGTGKKGRDIGRSDVVEGVSAGREGYVVVSYSGRDVFGFLGWIEVCQVEGGDTEKTMHEYGVLEGSLRDCGLPDLLEVMLVRKCCMSGDGVVMQQLQIPILNRRCMI